MSDQPQNESPKLHIDSDWKAQAQAEKQKLAAEAEAQGAAQGGPGELPPADIKTLISTMVSQALLYMGAIPEPSSGQRILHLDLARHNIDMLGVLEDKTTGNLSDEEQQLLTQAIVELRASFVELSKQVAAHQARQAAGGAQPQPGGQQPPSSGGEAGGGGIVMP
ncbi:DUF1844 domain-containing protein [Planctomycetales bacterium ZRK34]|nr:DUF1844 domain-containing protein [Planctomycetales bacterium ZRK34]